MEVLGNILLFLKTRCDRPQPFGVFHIVMLILTSAAAVFVIKWQKVANLACSVFFACFLLFGCKKYEPNDFCFTFLGFMVAFGVIFNWFFVIYTLKFKNNLYKI